MVDRYAPEICCDEWAEELENKFYSIMNLDKQGDYVSYGDYESLLEAYQSLCDKVREIYLETP